MSIQHKTVAFKVDNIDFEGRTFEGHAAVFGNVDLGGDIIHPGAFTKTLNERGGKIKLLWQHDTSEPLGRPLELAEDDAGLFVKGIISDTRRGRDALALLRDGAINEMSIGYETVKGGTDYGKAQDGAAVRNLREVKLWEVSIVTLAMNPEAQITALKEADAADADPEPDETKAVMKTEGDGEHPASHYLVVEDAEKPTTWHLRVRNAAGEVDHRLMGAAWAALHGGYRGNRYEGPESAAAVAKLTRLYASEGLDTPKALDVLVDGASIELADETKQAILNVLNGIPAPATEQVAHDDTNAEPQAGPDAKAAEATDVPPTSITLEQMEALLFEIELLEV